MYPESKAIDILMLNRGAHYEPAAAAAVEQTMRDVTAAYPHLWVIWRSTPGGHRNCEASFEAPPLLQPLPVVRKYGWESIRIQNFVIKDMLATLFPQVKCRVCSL